MEKSKETEKTLEQELMLNLMEMTARYVVKGLELENVLDCFVAHSFQGIISCQNDVKIAEKYMKDMVDDIWNFQVESYGKFKELEKSESQNDS